MRSISRRDFIKETTLGSIGLGLSPSIFSSKRSSKNPDQPNIILILCDQFRADVCKREGFGLDTTPFLDSMARSGTWFDKAYCAYPACAPSRASMLTGRWPNATHVKSNHNVLDAYFKTDMIDVVKSQGYKTGIIGKTGHSYMREHPERFDYFKTYGHLGAQGGVTAKEKKFNRYLESTDFYADFDPAPFSPKMEQPARIVNDAQNWIGSMDGHDDPFFLYLSIPEPHNPYQAPNPYYSMFPENELPPLKAGPESNKVNSKKYELLKKLMLMAYPNLEEHIPRLRSNYYGMMRLIDDQIKGLVSFMKKKKLYQNTLFIFVADHGDYVGEYGLMKKGAGVPECLTRIPMLWHGPGISQKAQPHSAHVSNTDIMPTICDMLGVDLPEGVQGRSLWPMLTGRNYPEAEFSSMIVQQGFGGLDYTSINELDPYKEGTLSREESRFFDELNTWTQSGILRMLRKDNWKLVFDMQGQGELYNLKNDPAEINDLFNKKKYASKREKLIQDLLAWELRTQDPLPLPRRRYKYKRDPHNYWAPYLENEL